MDTCDNPDDSPAGGRRKRTLSSHEEDSAFGPQTNKTRRSRPYEGNDDLGTSVDRHCKMRFVERLANVIGAQGQHEVSDEPWSIPALSRLKASPPHRDCHNFGDSSNLGLSNNSPARKESVAPDVSRSCTTAAALPLLLNDDELETIDNCELDALLDALLIRIVETLVNNGARDFACYAELNAHGQSGFALLHCALSIIKRR
jgi:hypothetical protein